MKIPQVKDTKLNYAVKKTACKPAADRTYGTYRTIADDMKRKRRKLSVKDKQKLEITYYLTPKEKRQWNRYSKAKQQRIIERAMKSPEYRKFQEQLNSMPDVQRNNYYAAQKSSKEKAKGYTVFSSGTKQYTSLANISGMKYRQPVSQSGMNEDMAEPEQRAEQTHYYNDSNAHNNAENNVYNDVQNMQNSAAEAMKNPAREMTQNTYAVSANIQVQAVKAGIKAINKIADNIKRTVQSNSADMQTEKDDKTDSSETAKPSGIIQKAAMIAATLAAAALQLLAPIFVIAAIIVAIVSIVTTIISVVFAPATIIKKAINALTTVSENVMQYETDVSDYAEEYGIKEYVPYLLAIMEVESHGEGEDVMQSSESLGLPPNSLSTDESIRQGVKYFSELIEAANAQECDIDTAVQAYNYGAGFINYVAENGNEYTFELAQEFAKEKSGGVVTDYANDISVAENGGWRYMYGNMFYVRLIKSYVTIFNNEVIKNVFEEAVKYEGDDYEYGGSNPDDGFDCSGLTQWCFGQAGISLPRTAQEQYDYVEHVELDELLPGDLVFFTKTTPSERYITHVGIYAGNDKIYEAGDPIGYYDFTDAWHQKHAVCGGRVVTVTDDEEDNEEASEESPEDIDEE